MQKPPIPNNEDWLAIERELCGRSFAHFIKLAWPHIIPDNLRWNWHLDAMAEHLEAVSRGEITRLLINVPPGASKSTMVGVMFPAWLWGPGGKPGFRYIGAAHEQGLAVRDNRLMRSLVMSEWYQRLWPIALMGDQNEKLYFENEKRGFRQACAVASMTGRRGHAVVWDDPLSPQKAYSVAHREEALRVLTETVPTRLNDPASSAIILVMQRLHEQDPSGYILSEGLGYEHLCIPMEFEADRRTTTSIGWTDPRKIDGELLDPVRFPQEVIDRDKKIMGQYAWAGQMQQRPAPRHGGMFPVDRFEIVDYPPQAKDIKASIRAWDKAGTADGGAYTAGVLMHHLHDGRFCIADVRRGQWASLDRERTIKQTAEIDGRSIRIVIEQEPGSGGKESAEATIRMLSGWPVKADIPGGQGSKEVRADPYAAQVQGGNVLIVRGDWNRAFIDEHEMFPNGKYKDQVDAAAMAFSGLNKTGFFMVA